jgi:hypothetical protein
MALSSMIMPATLANVIPTLPPWEMQQQVRTAILTVTKPKETRKSQLWLTSQAF